MVDVLVSVFFVALTLASVCWLESRRVMKLRVAKSTRSGNSGGSPDRSRHLITDLGLVLSAWSRRQSTVHGLGIKSSS